MRMVTMREVRWIIAALLLGVTAAGTARANAGAEPRIEATKRVIDLGVREPGPRVAIEFPLRNVGKAPLEITRAVPACGCMVARFDRRLLPGAKGAVRVLFDTEGRHGEIKKNIAVESTDPKTPRLVLTVRVLLRRAVEVSPGETIVLPTSEGRPTESQITLRSHEKSLLQIKRVTCSLPGVTTRVLTSAEVAERVAEGPGACQMIDLQFPETASVAAFDATVTIETNSLKRPRIAVQVTGVPRAAVSVQPPHLYFGNVARGKGEPVLRVITLFRPRGGVRVTGVEATDPNLSLKVEADPSGALCDVLAVYAGGWPLGLKRGTITIRTDDPKRPVVRVPYSAEVGEERDVAAGRAPVKERIAYSPPTPGPRVAVERTEIELGSVETGALAPATFLLKNEGDAPLKIESLRTRCGCLVASYDREIAPGRVGKIEATLNTRGHQGPMRKAIDVTTNDPRARRLTLHLSATVRRAVAVEPGEQVLMPLLPGKAGEQIVSLRSLDGQSFRILAITSSEPKLSAEPDTRGGAPAVRLRLPAAAVPREVTALVTLTLDHPKLPAVTLEVRGYPRPPVRCHPEQITFGPVGASEAITRDLLLLGDAGLRVLGVELSDPRLQAEPTALPDGEGWRIAVTLRGDGRPGPIRGTLTLRTDDPATPRIVVPYTAAIRPASSVTRTKR